MTLQLPSWAALCLLGVLSFIHKHQKKDPPPPPPPAQPLLFSPTMYPFPFSALSARRQLTRPLPRTPEPPLPHAGVVPCPYQPLLPHATTARLSFQPWLAPAEGIDSGRGVRPVPLLEMARALPGLPQTTLRLRVPRHLLLCLLMQL